MAEHVELNGVRTWYDERGSGEPLVLLRGGITDSRVFAGNLDTLADRFRVFTPERRGHGHTPDVEGPLTVGLMVEDASPSSTVSSAARRGWPATALARSWRWGSRSAGRTSSRSSCWSAGSSTATAG